MTYWCAAQTHVRSEDKAAFHLRRQGYKVFLPKYMKRRKHARRVDWVPAPLFPRYLFVALDLEEGRWWSIRSTVGVADIICFGNRPAAVPSEIIDEIRVRQDDKGLVKTQAGSGFKAGDCVRIIEGPLNDMEGLFDGPADENRVAILLDLMGREVKVHVPLEAVYASA